MTHAITAERYDAENQSEVADYFATLASDQRACIRFQTTKTAKRDCDVRAMVWEEAADILRKTTIRALAATPSQEVTDELVPFLAVWADRYQRDYGLNGLHPTHYDLLAKYGARLDGFRRATNATNHTLEGKK